MCLVFLRVKKNTHLMMTSIAIVIVFLILVAALVKFRMMIMIRLAANQMLANVANDRAKTIVTGTVDMLQ
jgi:hypothetical protein